MSLPITAERRLLTEAEFGLVARSHYPDVCGMPKPELVEIARRLRAFRDKARDVGRGRRREMRGKAEPRGAAPARDESGLSLKKQVFASALKRVNKEIGRHDAALRRPAQGEIARRALEMKQARRLRHHPSAGCTARTGMRPMGHDGATAGVDPRQAGSVSQATRDSQARRDG
ncbi:hypothetical protein CR162_14415 [Pseudoroseomonas rhizosphaerae]|uniref:Uncharacterized protein n=1 Tax=Teichococcus rhizosphaerae TaxID=1335062 RepID=A0A2C6Z6V1_9PROT|nr:hypothetical protein [Pseudoroseomonas rhizosphaerae]PHK94231.1 hypothetical protein CR162_14415 [Pseudoroseomonas rhizosphaerae]